MRYVVLSSDTNDNYAFYAPLTCAVWKAFGFEPLIFLVGNWTPASPNMYAGYGKTASTPALDALAPFKKVMVPAIEGRSTATTAQLVRIYGHAVEGINDDDYLLTSDVDMWPLGPWVGSWKSEPNTVHLYNGAAYSDQSHPQYPMCYVGAEARVWREIVGGDYRTTVGQGLKKGFEEFDRARATWPIAEVKERAWDFDERYLGRLIAAWPGKKVKISRTMSFTDEKRLDRSSWRIPTDRGGKPDLAGFADAHLPRPGFGLNWKTITPLLAKVLPEDQHVWARDYYKKWIER